MAQTCVTGSGSGKIRMAGGASDNLGRVARSFRAGETTVTPTRPRGVAPQSARQITVSGNHVGKTMPANWARITVCTTLAVMAAYTWKGVTRRGGAQAGATGMAPAGLPARVEARCRQGWRHLVVTAVGDGREAARTGPDVGGGRAWYVECA